MAAFSSTHGAPGPRLGAFLAPYHPLDEDPTLAIQRDLELMEHLDRLGYAEAWVGEHHSAGYEIIASPELFIAAAAERTRRIRLGTGVISLPYHNPLMVADRILQLDHMTRGRAMFGVGPGLLPSDARMLGIPVETQRARMAQALDVILRLIAGETVDEVTDWYTLEGARCQLRPYTQPRPEFAVASTVTPSGAKLAGKYDLGMLCVAATESIGYDVLDVNLRIASDVAREHGRSMNPSAVRLVGPMHVAETREQAFRDVERGLPQFLDYFRRVNPAASANAANAASPAEALVASGRAVIGTPEDAVAQIRRLQEKCGAFGSFLLLAHNWASWERTKLSYELIARRVAPVLQDSNALRTRSLSEYTENNQALTASVAQAARATIAEHRADVEKALRGSKTTSGERSDGE